VHPSTPISGSGHQGHELSGAFVASPPSPHWLEATHEGAVKPAVVRSHLDEFCFGFHPRNSRARSMSSYRLAEQSSRALPARTAPLSPNEEPVIGAFRFRRSTRVCTGTPWRVAPERDKHALPGLDEEAFRPSRPATTGA